MPVLQASSSDSDEEEAFLPVKRGAPQRSKRIEEEEEEEDSPVKAPAKRAKKAPPAGDSCMLIDLWLFRTCLGPQEARQVTGVPYPGSKCPLYHLRPCW